MGTNYKFILQCVFVFTIKAIKANIEETVSTTWASEKSTPRTNSTESS